MKKTPKMLEIEERFGEPIDIILTRLYHTERKNLEETGEYLNTSSTNLKKMLDKAGIKRRTTSESRLPPDFKEPTKDQLYQWYRLEGKSLKEIGDMFGISQTAVRKRLIKKKIPIKTWLESRLPPNSKEPTRDQLYHWYRLEGKSLKEIGDMFGISGSAVKKILDDKKIPTKTLSESRLPPDFKEPTRDQLYQWYRVEGKSTRGIGDMFGISRGTVKKMLDDKKIPIKTKSESGLLPDFKEPTRDQLYQWYRLERKSLKEIGGILGVSDCTVIDRMKKAGISIKTKSESRLPPDFKEPTKDQLYQWYRLEGKSLKEIGGILGISSTAVRNGLNRAGIRSKTMSESRLPPDFKEPTRDQLYQLYKVEEKSRKEIGKILGIGENAVGRRLIKAGIYQPRITNNKHFLNFLKEDKTACNLVAAAVSLNGQGQDIESIIQEIYSNRFKNKDKLHQMLNDNSREIIKMIQDGITNLGYYIGAYTLQDKAIIPVLLGNAIELIPEAHITSSLEEKLIRMLRINYSPQFNQDPNATMEKIRGVMAKNNKKTKNLYQRLYEHYESVLKLQQELR
ncbi:MAG: hypothetical protein KKG60_01335 [Nanoarchaeota archaeon]|nr:hypothetical protein [Nanoarchaeota archaeon]